NPNPQPQTPIPQSPTPNPQHRYVFGVPAGVAVILTAKNCAAVLCYFIGKTVRSNPPPRNTLSCNGKVPSIVIGVGRMLMRP
ncbi:hypothetical protein T484DRAFT_1608213, partial [Baffinella frigidus]